MGTPMLSGQTAALVTKEARLRAFGSGGTSYPVAHDPDHRKAWKQIEHQVCDWSEVRVHDAPGNGPRPLVFRAWRVSTDSWAWQTSQMAAPAFATYAPHGELTTDEYGTFCVECGEPQRNLARTTITVGP